MENRKWQKVTDPLMFGSNEGTFKVYKKYNPHFTDEEIWAIIKYENLIEDEDIEGLKNFFSEIDEVKKNFFNQNLIKNLYEKNIISIESID